MKISIVTVTYNCEDYICDCLKSVSEQSYKNIEHIVIDGASVDGTLAVLRENASKISVLISESDFGIYDALNKGIAHASGDVVGFLHADDIFASSDVIKWVADIFQKDQEVSAVYGNLYYVNRDNTDVVIRHWRAGGFSNSSLARGWMPPHPTLYVRREFYNCIGGFDSRYKISADYLSVLKLFSLDGFKVAFLDKCMIKMRFGGASNRSLSAIFRKSIEDWKALRQINFSFIRCIAVLFLKNFRKIHQFIAFRK